MSYTADHIDSYMLRYIGKPRGFYIEAGAFNGRGQSNTLLLSENGWTGILCEPNPFVFPQLVTNRPNDICLPYALVSDPAKHSAEFYCCEFMSLVAGARGDNAQDMQWIRDGEYAQGIAHKKVIVETRTLASILEANGSPEVDWLSLDVEGGELDALMGLGVHRPKTIVVELSRLIPETESYLKSIGYEFVQMLSNHDWLFKRI